MNNSFYVLQKAHHVQRGGNDTTIMKLMVKEGLLLLVPLLDKQPMKESLVLQEIKEAQPQEVVNGNQQDPLEDIAGKVGVQLIIMYMYTENMWLRYTMVKF